MSTYNWYFSQSGNDSTGDGSFGNPWKTLSKAKTQIDTVGISDIVNLYFNRGDTWTINTLAKTNIHGFEVEIANPIVNMNAYGLGYLPCIDGLVTDFSVAPVHNVVTGPLRWSSIFKFSRVDCSVFNIEFKQIYGNVIELRGATYFHLSHCNVHHFGQGCISVGGISTEDNIIEYNLIHTGQQLWRYGLRPAGWGAAIGYSDQTLQNKNNLVRYNLVYDIFGEGINNAGGISEYNLVGDTYSTGIYVSPHNYNAVDTIVRYNFITMSGSSDYQYPYPIPAIHNWRAAHNGIGIIDEDLGGSNANANIEFYGNVVINRYYGIYAKNSEDPGNPFKSIKIYNNTVIDCKLGNYIVSQPNEFTEGHIYNNVSILYNRITAIHGGHGATFPHPNWTIENNSFWTTGGLPIVDDGWTTNYVIADPKLSGEPTVDWTGQSGPTYYKDIKFNDIRPLVGSSLIGSGKVLGAGFEDSFLIPGTDFSGLPDIISFVEAIQGASWEIGACIYAELPPSTPMPTTTLTTVAPTTTLTTMPPTTAPPALVVQDVVVDFATTPVPTTVPPTTLAPDVICIKNLKSTIAKEMRLNGNLC